MVHRKIIHIDHELCNGCGECVPDCPEGAIQIIDGKAHLISDIFCDGLGACLGTCPEGAISTIVREAEEYDEKRTMENIVKGGPNVIRAHLKHLRDHAQCAYFEQAVEFLNEKGIEIPEIEEETLPCGCPGTEMRVIDVKGEGGSQQGEAKSALRQWPLQIHLLHPKAPFLDNSHLLLLSDCVAVANPNVHSQLIHGRSVAMGCPKLDDSGAYINKLTEIMKHNRIKSVTVAVMEVPCCSGMVRIAKEAISRSGKEIPLIVETISVEGELL